MTALPFGNFIGVINGRKKNKKASERGSKASSWQ